MKNQKRALFGIFLIIIGLAFLLDNLDLLPAIPRFVFHWTNIFFVIALINLVSGNLRPALIFFLLGIFFVLEHYLDFDFRDYWPLILIIVGFTFLLSRGKSGVGLIREDYFDDINIFSGAEKKITSKSLKGGKITTIFGGASVDLRESNPEPGATIEIFTMFGGCEIIVPDNWQIHQKTTAIFGAFDDKRSNSNPHNDVSIYITGLTLFGGGELRSSPKKG